MLKIIIAIFFIIAHGFNWYSTKRTQIDYDWFFYEANPLMGREPTITIINFYFVFTGIVALIGLIILPSIWGILGVTIYGTINIFFAIRDFYKIYKIKRRPKVPKNIKIVLL
jgi:hypothetical protein